MWLDLKARLERVENIHKQGMRGQHGRGMFVTVQSVSIDLLCTFGAMIGNKSPDTAVTSKSTLSPVPVASSSTFRMHVRWSFRPVYTGMPFSLPEVVYVFVVPTQVANQGPLGDKMILSVWQSSKGSCASQA